RQISSKTFFSSLDESILKTPRLSQSQLLRPPLPDRILSSMRIFSNQYGIRRFAKPSSGCSKAIHGGTEKTSRLLKKTHMLRCRESSRYKVKIGIVEGWNDELMRLKTQYSNIPIFQHPISVTPLSLFEQPANRVLLLQPTNIKAPFLPTSPQLRSCIAFPSYKQ